MRMLIDVNSLSPTRGSLAGGTKVTIDGGGFSGDPYDTTNVVFFCEAPCDVDWFNSGTSMTRIVCWTRPYVEAREDSSSSRLTTRVYVGPQSRTYTSTTSRRFRHEWGVTPYIETVSPHSGPAGYLVVQIRGNFSLGTISGSIPFELGQCRARSTSRTRRCRIGTGATIFLSLPSLTDPSDFSTFPSTSVSTVGRGITRKRCTSLRRAIST